MVHRGGTVAGESPDRSEQRKSSGETAPGERDPRLATAVRADQPTAVFTLPPDPEAETESGSAPESGPETDADADTDRGPVGTDADADTDAAGSGADADADTGTDADADNDTDADTGTDADTDAEIREAGLRALAAGADAPTAEVTAVVPAPLLSGPEKPQEAPGAAEETGDAPEAAEDAPGASTGGRDAAGGDAEAADGDTDGEARGDSDDDSNDDEADNEADADAGGGRGAVTTTVTFAKPAKPAGDAAADTDDDGGADAEDGTDTEDTEDAADTKDAGADKADEDGPVVDTPTAVFGTLRKPAAGAPAVDSPTTALKLPPAPRPESDPVAKGSGEGSGEGAGEDSDVAAGRGAATKPVAKPAESAGDTARDTAEESADDASGDAGRRASTFVPLKSTEPKPAPAAPAVPAPAAPPAPEPAALAEAERTRQQPMPPLPPMDLLAELTNTPPTPMRKVARRFKIWTPLLLVLLIIGAVAQILRPLPPPDLELSTQPTFTFKGAKLTLPFPADGQGAVAVEGVGTIGTYGPQEVAPTASVAKAMTAYVILRDRPLKKGQQGRKITVDKQAAEETGRRNTESVAELSEGQVYTMKQMLQLTMIPSGNNAARLLARWHAGSEAAFVAKMNEAAKSLGMNNTVYTDPSGFKKTTVSTPEDQLKLAEAVMNDEVMREITNTTMMDVPGAGTIRNGNDRALLHDGVDGIKTGSSTPAGGNLLWSFVKPIDGTLYRVNGIAMNVRDGDSPYQKTQKAIDYSLSMINAARKGLQGATVVKKGEAVGYLDNGLGGRVPVMATRDLKAVGWGGLELRLNLTMKKGELPRSGNAGDVIGELSIGSGPDRETVPVALRENLTEPGLTDKLTRVG
ncbi:D-alanyl-D-alanine carboxypeptidase family protein [Streptomyces sp. NPDC003691]